MKKPIKIKFFKEKKLKGTKDYVLPFKTNSIDELLHMGRNEKFTPTEILYQLPANPRATIKKLLVSAIVLRAIDRFINLTKKEQEKIFNARKN